MTESPTLLNILALLSEPLVDGQGNALERLDLHQAAREVMQQMQVVSRAGTLRFTAATAHNVLNQMRDHGPFDVLHFYGHGNEGTLAFEDGRGGLQALDAQRLQALFAPDGRSPAKVALLTACHSETMAQALLDAGVPHVVAIDAALPVLEVAARAFVAHFYPALFSGRSVRQAFDFGRTAVFTNPIVAQASQYRAAAIGKPDAGDWLQRLETAKFRLLPEAEEGKPDPHAAHYFEDAATGVLRIEGLSPPPPTVARRPDHFTGRQKELHQLIQNVLDYRLTTVQGTGGMGKSELCREAARWFAARNLFPGGIFFVSLGAVNRAGEALLNVAVAARVDPQAAQTAQTLARSLPPRCLLILDETDSLLLDDPQGTREMLQALRDYSDAALLLASRYWSHAGGERRQPLRRLPPPQARRMFLKLAPAELSGSEAQLAETLALLDGFPRAIELAAKQIYTPDLGLLLADLRASREEILNDPGIPPELRRDGDSVLVTLNSSFRRLQQRDAAAAEFFPYLALFPAGISLEGLGVIFGQERARLARPIVEMALAETAPPLDYIYLPAPVRSYAARRLPPQALHEIGDAALRHYHTVAEQYNDLIVQGKDELGVALFALELPNLEPFLAWGYAHEAATGEKISRSARITGLLQNFFVYFDPGRTQMARYEQALNAVRRLEDRLGEANTLKAIGDVQNFRKEIDAALESYQQALALFRAVGDRLGEANTLQAIGDVQNFRDERDAALESYQQALALFRAVGARLGEANTLKALGNQRIDQGDGENGLKFLQAALDLYTQIDSKSGQANVYWDLGIRLVQNGALAEGEPLIARAVELGNQFAPGHPVTLQMENVLAQVRAQLDASGQ